MAKFIPIDDVIKSANLFEGDILQRNKMRYHALAKQVWYDLNMQTIKIAVRLNMGINKRTNTIDLPKDCVELASVSVIDPCTGIIYPVFRNDRLHDDIVDIGASKNCECGCKNQLCNLIKGYESITLDIDAELPNGDMQTFHCTTRKSVDTNGFYYEEKQFPIRRYTNGIWTSTEVATESIELCKLDVDDNGCVIDCEENFTKVNSCACSSCCVSASDNNGVSIGGTSMASCDGSSTWIYACSSVADVYSVECGAWGARCRNNEFRNIYNITEEGNRLIFPANFGWGKALVRYYADVSLRDLKIPVIAVPTFQVGMKYYDTLLKDDREQRILNQQYSQQYSAMQFGLLKELNKYTIKELGKIIAQPAFIPSYVLNNQNAGFNVW